MVSFTPGDLDFDDAWLESDRAARWRSAAGHGRSNGARSSGSSVIEIEPGHRLPLHTDSAEETIVVLAGAADVLIGEDSDRIPAGGVALVPKDLPHEVRNAGTDVLRFAAVYAEPEVVTTYCERVQPGGSRKRRPVA